MSNAAKTGIAVIIVIILIIIAWSFWGNRDVQAPPAPVQQNATSTATTTTVQDPLAGTGMTAQNDVSTESLQKDMEAVDAQFNGLTKDFTNIDSGLSSQSIPVQK